MFISTKLTTEGKPQISAALPIKAAAFTVKPFLRETLLFPPLSLTTKTRGKMHSYFEKQQVITSFQGMKPNKTLFFFLPLAFPRKMKKVVELSTTHLLGLLSEMLPTSFESSYYDSSRQAFPAFQMLILLDLKGVGEEKQAGGGRGGGL